MGQCRGQYEIDTLRLLTLSGGVFGGRNTSRSHGENWMGDMQPVETRVYDYRYDTDAKNKNNWYSVRGNVDYQRTAASNKARLFTLSYNINANPSDRDGWNKYSYNSEEMPAEWENLLQLNNMD